MVSKERIRFLKHAIKYKGKRSRVSYSKGNYTKQSGLPEGTITIYARDYGNQLPSELNPENETDIQTDLFMTDTVRIKPKSKYYKDVLKLIKKEINI